MSTEQIETITVIKKCNGKTQQGTQCTRNAKNGDFCYQHNNSQINIKTKTKSKTIIDKSGDEPLEFKHPSFKIMIGIAILSNVTSKKGSSRQSIKKYMSANYNINPTNVLINKNIKLLLQDGDLIPHAKYGGHYRCSPTFKKSVLIAHPK